MLGRLLFESEAAHYGATASGPSKANASSGSEPFADCTAGPQQSNSNGSFGPAMGARDFLDLVAFQVVALQHHAVVLLASFQNTAHVDGREVDLRRRSKLG